MLEIIPATTIPVAGTTVAPSRRTHFLSNLCQINILVWIPAGVFLFGIAARGIMANQTGHIGHIRKIKSLILPPVTGMTFGAPAPIRFDAHSVVVHQIYFAKLDPLSTAF